MSYLLTNNTSDVLCLNEMFCDDSIRLSDDELHIEGLMIERNDRTRSGGGVAIYISRSLQYVRRRPRTNMYSFEFSVFTGLHQVKHHFLKNSQ